MFLGTKLIDELLTFPANTHTPSTGAATDADSVPTYRVYEDETGTALLSGSMAKLDDANTLGFYTKQIALSAVNGIEVGKAYTIYITATVGGVTGTMSHSFAVKLATVDVGKWLGTTVPAPDTNGYPKVTVKDGTGQGEILTTAGAVDEASYVYQLDELYPGGPAASQILSHAYNATHIFTNESTSAVMFKVPLAGTPFSATITPIDQIVSVVGGTGKGQTSRVCTAWDNALREGLIPALDVALDTTSIISITAAPPAASTGDISSAVRTELAAELAEIIDMAVDMAIVKVDAAAAKTRVELGVPAVAPGDAGGVTIEDLTEPATVPGFTAKLATKMAYLLKLVRNKQEVTDDGTTVTVVVKDDAGTTTQATRTFDKDTGIKTEDV